MRINLLLLLIFLFGSCGLQPDTYNNFPHGNDTAVTLKSMANSSTAGVLNFEANLIFLLGSSDYLTLGYIEQGNLSFTGNGTYTITSFENVEVQPASFANAMILVDQSGSYADVDSKNMRSKGINKLLHDLGQYNFLLGGFSKGGRLSAEPLELNGAFSSSADASVPYLFDLPVRTGGQCVVYDGLMQAIEKLKTVSGPRSIIVLGHNPDQASMSTVDQVIAAAQLNQVAIHIIFIGLPSDAQALAKLSQSTGGLFSLCTEAEMITSFNQLKGMLADKRFIYKVKVKFVPTGGTVIPGSETFHQVNVHDAIHDVEFNPLQLYLKAP